MALHIMDPRADELARKLSSVTGETLTEAVTKALEERLDRTAADRERRFERIMEIVREVAKLPVLDDRTADEIIGYDENGLPT